MTINQPLIELIIESDDEAMEQYFEGNPPSEETIKRLMVEAIAAGTLVPIVCVSSKTGVGMEELLDAMASPSRPPLMVLWSRKSFAPGSIRGCKS